MAKRYQGYLSPNIMRSMDSVMTLNIQSPRDAEDLVVKLWEFDVWQDATGLHHEGSQNDLLAVITGNVSKRRFQSSMVDIKGQPGPEAPVLRFRIKGDDQVHEVPIIGDANENEGANFEIGFSLEHAGLEVYRSPDVALVKNPIAEKMEMNVEFADAKGGSNATDATVFVRTPEGQVHERKARCVGGKLQLNGLPRGLVSLGFCGLDAAAVKQAQESAHKKAEEQKKKLESTAKKILEQKKSELEDLKRGFDSKQKEVDEEKKHYEQEKTKLDADKKTLDADKKALDEEKKKLAEEREKLEAERKKLDEEKKKLDADKKDLEQQKKDLPKGGGYKPTSVDGGGSAGGKTATQRIGGTKGGAYDPTHVKGCADLSGSKRGMPATDSGKKDDPNKLSNARWEKPKGRPGNAVKLFVDVGKGIADGTEVSFEIKEQDQDGNDDDVTTLKGKVEAGKAVTEWKCEYVEDTDDVITDQEKKWKEQGFAEFTLPELYFIAKADGSESKSGLFEIADVIEGVLEFDDGTPMANKKFELHFTKGGKLEGKTDAKGHFKVDNVPPGEADLRLIDEPASGTKPQTNDAATAAAAAAAGAVAGAAAAVAAGADPQKDDQKPEEKGKLSNARWGKDKVRPGDKVELLVDVGAGLPDGTEVTFELKEKDDDGKHDFVKNLTGKAEGGKAKAEWEVEYISDEDDTISDKEKEWQKKGFKDATLPELFFVAKASNCDDQPESNVMTIADFIEGTLQYDDGTPMADRKFKLVFKSGGELEGKTDAQGKFRVDDVPPGDCELSFVDDKPTKPQAQDGVPSGTELVDPSKTDGKGGSSAAAAAVAAAAGAAVGAAAAAAAGAGSGSGSTGIADGAADGKGGKPPAGGGYDPNNAEGCGTESGGTDPQKDDTKPEDKGKLSNARWSKPKARPGDKVELLVDVGSELADGTEVTFEIKEKDDDGKHDFIKNLTGKAEGGKAKAEWDVEYVSDEDDTISDKEKEWQKKGFEQFTLPELFFVAKASNCDAQPESANLTISDFIEGTLTLDDGTPMANRKFKLVFKPKGEIPGTTDAQGKFRVEDVPPGDCELVFVDDETPSGTTPQTQTGPTPQTQTGPTPQTQAGPQTGKPAGSGAGTAAAVGAGVGLAAGLGAAALAGGGSGSGNAGIAAGAGSGTKPAPTGGTYDPNSVEGAGGADGGKGGTPPAGTTPEQKGKLSNARWSKPKARPGDKVELLVDVGTELPEGTEVTFELKEKDDDGKHDFIKNLTAKAEGGKAKAEWEVEYVSDEDDTLTDKEKEWQKQGFAQFTLPELFFVAKASNCDAQPESGNLTIADFIEGVLAYDDGKPMANRKFKLVFKPKGEIQGSTDAEGKFRVEDVPPGDCELVFIDDAQGGGKGGGGATPQTQTGPTPQTQTGPTPQTQDKPSTGGGMSTAAAAGVGAVAGAGLGALGAAAMAGGGAPNANAGFAAGGGGGSAPAGGTGTKPPAGGDYDPNHVEGQGGAGGAAGALAGGAAGAGATGKTDEQGKLRNARWSKPKARPEDKVELLVDVDKSLPDGTEVTFEIIEKDDDGKHDFIKNLTGKAQGGTAKAEWDVEYISDEDDTLTDKEKEWQKKGFEQFSLPELHFIAKARNVDTPAESGCLTIADFIEGVLSYNDGRPMANRKFKLVFKPKGEIQGSTDAEGKFHVDDVPPGECELVFIDDDPAAGGGKGAPAGSDAGKGGSSGKGGLGTAAGIAAGAAVGGLAGAAVGAALSGGGSSPNAGIAAGAGGDASKQDGKLKNARWSQEKVRPDVDVELLVDVDPSIPDGTEIVFEIKEEDQDGEDDDVTVVKGKVEGGKGKAVWKTIYFEDTDDVLTEQEKEWQKQGFAQFSLPEFYFIAKAAGAEAKSGIMTISDFIEGVLKYNDGRPMANRKFKLVFQPKGEIQGSTDEKGEFKVDNVPPGKCQMVFLDDAASGKGGAAGAAAGGAAAGGAAGAAAGAATGKGGSTDGKGGSTDGKGGSTDGKGGSTDGKGGSTDGKGGSTDGKGGSTDGKGGSTDGKGGSTDDKKKGLSIAAKIGLGVAAAGAVGLGIAALSGKGGSAGNAGIAAGGGGGSTPPSSGKGGSGSTPPSSGKGGTGTETGGGKSGTETGGGKGGAPTDGKGGAPTDGKGGTPAAGGGTPAAGGGTPAAGGGTPAAGGGTPAAGGGTPAAGGGSAGGGGMGGVGIGAGAGAGTGVGIAAGGGGGGSSSGGGTSSGGSTGTGGAPSGGSTPPDPNDKDFIEARLIDDQGKPLKHQKVTVVFSATKKFSALTDGEGNLKIDKVPTGEGELFLGDAPADGGAARVPGPDASGASRGAA